MNKQAHKTNVQTNVQTIKIHIEIKNVSKQTQTNEQKRKADRNYNQMKE